MKRRTKNKKPQPPANVEQPGHESEEFPEAGRSQSAIAKLLSVDRRTVANVIDEAGIYPVGQRSGHALYDPDQVATALESLRASAINDKDRFQAACFMWRSEKLRIEALRAAGEVIDTGLVADVAGQMVANARAKLLAFPRKIGPMLEGMTGAEIVDALETGIHEVLCELASMDVDEWTQAAIQRAKLREEEDDAATEDGPAPRTPDRDTVKANSALHGKRQPKPQTANQ